MVGVSRDHHPYPGRWSFPVGSGLSVVLWLRPTGPINKIKTTTATMMFDEYDAIAASRKRYELQFDWIGSHQTSWEFSQEVLTSSSHEINTLCDLILQKLHHNHGHY